MKHDLLNQIPAGITFGEEPTDSYACTLLVQGSGSATIAIHTFNRGRDRKVVLHLSEKSALQLIQVLADALIQKNPESN